MPVENIPEAERRQPRRGDSLCAQQENRLTLLLKKKGT